MVQSMDKQEKHTDTLSQQLSKVNHRNSSSIIHVVSALPSIPAWGSLDSLQHFGAPYQIADAVKVPRSLVGKTEPESTHWFFSIAISVQPFVGIAHTTYTSTIKEPNWTSKLLPNKILKQNSKPKKVRATFTTPSACHFSAGLRPTSCAKPGPKCRLCRQFISFFLSDSAFIKALPFLWIYCNFSSPIIHLVRRLGSSIKDLQDVPAIPRSERIWLYSWKATVISA